MDVRIITVGKLNDFVKSPFFEQLTDVPITPLRAFSQSLNPNAQAGDPALVIAFDEQEQVLAYFGCLPERLKKNGFNSSGGYESYTEKCCWSSCWWVHPTMGQAAAMPVFYKALQLWDAKMLFDALPERSEAVLEKMGYFSFRKIIGLHVFLRFKFHKMIPAKIPFLAPLKNIFYVVDFLLNTLVELRLKLWQWKNSISGDIQITQIDSKRAVADDIQGAQDSVTNQIPNAIDSETEHFIQSLSKNEIFQRNEETFNWIINNSWLSPNKTFTKKYHFSSQANHFEHVLLTIHRKDKMVAFLWLTLRDGTAKLPYCYIIPGQEETTATLLIHQLIQQPVDTFICFQQNILTALEKVKAPFLYKKERSKTFGWTKTLDPYFTGDFYVQDGDGDGVFT